MTLEGGVGFQVVPLPLEAFGLAQYSMGSVMGVGRNSLVGCHWYVVAGGVCFPS